MSCKENGFPLRSNCFIGLIPAAAYCLLSINGTAFGASGTDDPLLSETEFFTEIPAVSSVTRLPQLRSETPAAVSIIDREMIIASGARHLSDLLRLVPGFQVAYMRQDIANVTYHGLGDTNARRLLIRVDGRSAYGSFTGDIDWHNIGISLNDIERIEVIRGPNTVTYGDNAFLATVNIITRHAAQTRRADLNAKLGNHDIGDAELRFAHHFEDTDIRLTAGTLSEDGYDQRQDDFKSAFVNLRADSRIGKRDDLLLQLGYNQSTSGVGAEGNPAAPPADRDRNSHFEQIQWRHRFTPDHYLKLQLYHNYDETDLDYEIGPFNAGPLGTITVPVSRDLIEERLDLELEHGFRINPSLRMVWGLGTREDSAASEPLFNSSATLKKNSSRLFGNGEWRATERVFVNVGGMWENSDFSDTEFSPRLALNFLLDDHHTFRAVWSQAQRIPAVGEQLADRQIVYQGFLVDQIYTSVYDLHAETMNSVELGYLGRFPRSSLTLDLRLYRDRIEDYITHTVINVNDIRDDLALALINSGDITIDGLDAELSYQPDRDMRLVFTQSFMKGEASHFNDSVYSAQQFEQAIPDYSGSLLAILQLESSWTLSMGVYWVDEVLWLRQATGNRHRPVDAYERVDLRLAKRVRMGDASGVLALVLQNIGDEYQDYLRNVYYDTHGYVSFGVEF